MRYLLMTFILSCTEVSISKVPNTVNDTQGAIPTDTSKPSEPSTEPSTEPMEGMYQPKANVLRMSMRQSQSFPLQILDLRLKQLQMDNLSMRIKQPKGITLILGILTLPILEIQSIRFLVRTIMSLLNSYLSTALIQLSLMSYVMLTQPMPSLLQSTDLDQLSGGCLMGLTALSL